MDGASWRVRFELPPRQLLRAAALIGVAVAVLWVIGLLIGAGGARVGYLALMFMVSPARLPDPAFRALAAAWAVVVAMAGFLIGPLGLGPTIAGLVVACLVQGQFRVGQAGAMVRSPVNFVAMSTLAQTSDVALWQVAAGAVIGAGLMLALSFTLPTNRPTSDPTARTGEDAPDPVLVSTSLDRWWSGVTLTVGSFVIVVVADLLDFAFTEWALLSLCVILAVAPDGHRRRSYSRILGSVVGAGAATLITLLPAPLPMVAAIVAGVLCIAYRLAGRYLAYVVFLTPAVLLTTSSDLTGPGLGLGRVEAVVAAATVALMLDAVSSWLYRRWHARTAERT